LLNPFFFLVWDQGVGLFLKWITKSDKIPHNFPHLLNDSANL